MTGGEDPQAKAERSAAVMWADDAASRALGMRLVSVGPGAAVVEMAVRPDMVNGFGLAHGGLIAALADSAFAFACNSYGTVTVAAGFDATFLEPAREGDRLVATAQERAVRGRSGLYDVTVRREDGTLIAELRGRSRSLGRPLGRPPSRIPGQPSGAPSGQPPGQPSGQPSGQSSGDQPA